MVGYESESGRTFTDQGNPSTLDLIVLEFISVVVFEAPSGSLFIIESVGIFGAAKTAMVFSSLCKVQPQYNRLARVVNSCFWNLHLNLGTELWLLALSLQARGPVGCFWATQQITCNTLDNPFPKYRILNIAPLSSFNILLSVLGHRHPCHPVGSTSKFPFRDDKPPSRNNPCARVPRLNAINSL